MLYATYFLGYQVITECGVLGHRVGLFRVVHVLNGPRQLDDFKHSILCHFLIIEKFNREILRGGGKLARVGL